MLFSDQLLTWLLLYGYPLLFAVVLVGSLGAPIPNNILILAAGGLAAEGDLELPIVLAVVFGAAILGDLAVFAVCRRLGEHAVVRYGARVGLTRDRLAAARTRFGTWVGLSVFLTRWLLTPLALPAGVLAGIGRYSASAFVGCAVAGELLWTAGYVGVGYLFGESWSGILDTASDSAGLVAALGVAVLALGLLVYLRAKGSAPSAQPG
jgi:membrane-associated protein